MINFHVTVLVTLFLISILLASYYAVSFLRKYSIKNKLIDIPNNRSSHTIPTPSGGGLSIALSVLLVIGLLYFGSWIKEDIASALGVGSFIVVLIGWLDDHHQLPALWRAICYFIAAAWAVYCLDGVETIQLSTKVLLPNQLGSLLAVFWIVWLTNLYNFMDGIDGIAGSESICVSLFSGVVFFSIGENGLGVICFVVLMSTCGFLYWNWPPAKIFMGDVGSCLLGFFFGVLAIIGEKYDAITIVAWLILLAVFIVDGTLTLFMRIMQREKWYNAHCSHAYQRLVQMGVSHKKVSVSVLLINVAILWPMAYMALVWKEYSFYIVSITLFLLSVLWLSIQVYYHRNYS
jgi:Fuc2NAc and GlcNAc transferase